ncbi:DUF1641 domain-containing protein [Shouchella lehensis]|uniref:DUF1641 domain-containing protein n=1 Tax=Shouchella lehensis TaxID=300825 RepID=A0A4Y7WS72_9BACI|nr:DUF1641 domain-containing protein [Shouchella lehensis]MBG9783615.1 hypothetical protein [Shouchella lehensis]TES51436.1 DUF1641 domain-containing protein [Shouchella lehensis]
MAKAATVIRKMPVDPNAEREKELRELENALLENKDALTSVLSLLHKLEQTEALNIAHSLLDQKNPLLHQLVTKLDDPHITQALKNMLVIVQSLGSIKLADLEPMLFKINSALNHVSEYEHTHQQNQSSAGYLLKSLKDPKTLDGMNTLLALLKGMGEDQSANETNQPQAELSTIANESYQQPQMQESTESSSGTKWYVIAAGALAFALPLLLKRK